MALPAPEGGGCYLIDSEAPVEPLDENTPYLGSKSWVERGIYNVHMTPQIKRLLREWYLE